MLIETIKITSTIFSIIGSLVLAYRVTGILSALSFVASAHEANIQQLMPNQIDNIYNFGNSIEYVEKAQKTGFLIFGFAMSVFSGILQLVALLMTSA